MIYSLVFNGGTLTANVPEMKDQITPNANVQLPYYYLPPIILADVVQRPTVPVVLTRRRTPEHLPEKET